MTILFKIRHDDEFKEVKSVSFYIDNKKVNISDIRENYKIVYYPKKQLVYIESSYGKRIYCRLMSDVSRLEIDEKD
jgi:hypothetical protein